MHFFYKTLTYILFFFSPAYFFLRKLKKKEHQIRYKEKLCKINLSRGEGYLIWFHVSSVGEIISIFPLIENLEKNDKVKKILITTITLSSSEVFNKKYGQNKKIVHQFLPLDVPKLVEKFLDHWSPNLSILVESEIWPNLIIKIKQKKIPLLLLNARLTKKSFFRWKLIKNFAKKIFEKFDTCIVSNKETENFLRTLGAKNIKNYGNLKFTNGKSNNGLHLDYMSKIKNRKVWCAASTHQPEEIICARAHLKIKKIYNNVLTIIIPRHVERIDQIKKKLSDLKLEVILFSNFDQINNNSDILLVDSYGETSKFYKVAKSVFLGKSLIKSSINNSGQNPIEPSRFGCKILHGPNVSNFSEIYDYLKSLEASKKINDAEDLGQSLIDEFDKNNNSNNEIIKKIENYGQDILNNITKELKMYITH